MGTHYKSFKLSSVEPRRTCLSSTIWPTWKWKTRWWHPFCHSIVSLRSSQESCAKLCNLLLLEFHVASQLTICKPAIAHSSVTWQGSKIIWNACFLWLHLFKYLIDAHSFILSKLFLSLKNVISWNSSPRKAITPEVWFWWSSLNIWLLVECYTDRALYDWNPAAFYFVLFAEFC